MTRLCTNSTKLTSGHTTFSSAAAFDVLPTAFFVTSTGGSSWPICLAFCWVHDQTYEIDTVFLSSVYNYEWKMFRSTHSGSTVFLRVSDLFELPNDLHIAAEMSDRHQMVVAVLLFVVLERRDTKFRFGVTCKKSGHTNLDFVSPALLGRHRLKLL